MPREVLLDDPAALFKAHEKISIAEMQFNGEEKKVSLVTRHDPIFPFYKTIISEERARRQKPAQKLEALAANNKTNCFFEHENLHNTPEPRRHYPELSVDEFTPVSVPNLYTFALEGRVNCFTAHDRCDPSKITTQDMYNYLEMSRNNAILVKNRGYDRMFNFINFGIKAAGTQEHPHSQDGIVENDSFVSAGPIGDNARELKHYARRWSVDEDIFDRYALIMNKSSYWGFETSGAVVMAPHAPQFPDQLDVIAKSNVGNFTDLEKLDMPGVAQALAYSINFLCTERGVTDFNLISHQTPFSENAKNVYKNYRLHFHIFPRNKNLIGGIEIDRAYSIIDIYPEDTASALREYIGKKELGKIPEIRELGNGR